MMMMMEKLAASRNYELNQLASSRLFSLLKFKKSFHGSFHPLFAMEAPSQEARFPTCPAHVAGSSRLRYVAYSQVLFSIDSSLSSHDQISFLFINSLW
jgi:hypothetical protein